MHELAEEGTVVPKYIGVTEDYTVVSVACAFNERKLVD
jgi:hypothetical protein